MAKSSPRKAKAKTPPVVPVVKPSVVPVATDNRVWLKVNPPTDAGRAEFVADVDCVLARVGVEPVFVFDPPIVVHGGREYQIDFVNGKPAKVIEKRVAITSAVVWVAK